MKLRKSTECKSFVSTSYSHSFHIFYIK